DEVAYLALHMGGFLKHNHAEKRDAKRIYLVCDEGVAVQKLLLKQCLYHLPNENLGAVSRRSDRLAAPDAVVQHSTAPQTLDR
ncbi:PRD protein, partial [human gut metagenome]